MKITKTFQYKLLPDVEQNEVLLQHSGTARFVWNQLVSIVEEKRKNKELFPNLPNQQFFQELIKNFKINDETKFVKEPYSQPIQILATRMAQVCKKSVSKIMCSKRSQKIIEANKILDPVRRKKKLDKAFKFGYPKFKNKHDKIDSLTYTQSNSFEVGKTRINFAKIGWIKYIQNVPIQGKPKTAVIKQRGNNWFVSITCELELEENKKIDIDNANIIGIDVGVKTFAQFSDGNKIENPKFNKKYEKRIAKEHRALARKQMIETKVKDRTTGKKGKNKKVKINSKNRDKQVLKLNKAYEKVLNCRKNFLHQITHNMITKYDGFIVEDLDIFGLVEKNVKENKKNMVKSIYDVSHAEYFRILEYKSLWNNKYFYQVDPYFPSTIRCPFCGFIDHTITLEDRILTCPHCKTVMERDLRSSISLKLEGVRNLKIENKILQELEEFTPVESSLKRADDEAGITLLLSNTL